MKKGGLLKIFAIALCLLSPLFAGRDVQEAPQRRQHTQGSELPHRHRASDGRPREDRLPQIIAGNTWIAIGA